MRGGEVTRLIQKIRDIYNDDKGNYLILSTVIFLVMIILTVGMVEFGRVIMFRNQLQTAGDAAALAAAGSDEDVTKWVRVTVTTDRGQREVCGKDECHCVGCNTVSITVTGLEEDLLDGGAWQDFCLPPCDCGGDECTIQIKDRWVTMTTATVTTGANAADISTAIGNIVSTTKEALSYKAYPNEKEVQGVLADADSMSEIQSYLDNSMKFTKRYERLYCPPVNITDAYTEEDMAKYNACVTKGRKTWQKIQGNDAFLTRMTNAVNKLNGLGQKDTTAGVSKEYVGEVVHDYLIANLPGSWATEVEVYDQRSSRFYPSVVVYAMTDVKVLMKDFVDIPLLLDPGGDYFWGNDDTVATVRTCSQGDIHYIDPSLTEYNDQGELSASAEDRYYVARPDDACSQ